MGQLLALAGRAHAGRLTLLKMRQRWVANASKRATWIQKGPQASLLILLTSNCLAQTEGSEIESGLRDRTISSAS